MIIAAAAAALAPDLLRAMGNPAIAGATQLLALLPEAARSDHYDARLQALGLDVTNGSDFLGLLHAFGNVMDRQNVSFRRGPRSGGLDLVLSGVPSPWQEFRQA